MALKTKTIKQVILFQLTPHELYEMILDPKKHLEFTGAKAKIDRKVHGKFSVWDGYITGENIKLEKDKKIVQRWTCSDLPEGYYTEVAFEFKKAKEGTQLIFTQTKVPLENYKELVQGWKDYYWKPIKIMSDKIKRR
jgi:activator of HSP90 ATPase